VGPNAAFLTQNGDLTDIGSLYLGGGKTGKVPKGGAAGRMDGKMGRVMGLVAILAAWVCC